MSTSDPKSAKAARTAAAKSAIEHRKLISTTFTLLLVIHLTKLGRKSAVTCLAVDHCYSDIGCFPLSEEFYHPRHRPINVRPWHRGRIGTQFELYSRRFPDGFILEPWNGRNLRDSGFNPALETKVIVPGWLDNVKRAVWVRRLRDALLWLWRPVNIIVVHWRNFTPYTIATANTRVVGAELANLIKSIEFEFAYSRLHYHLIGHSLGAHISGYCGDRVTGLGRITALDPARPFFQGMPKSVRLDRDDAKFVDAIHSDFTPENAILFLMSFGMTTPVGHLDFYPNGPALIQPGCFRDAMLSLHNGLRRGRRYRSLPVALLETIRYLTACDHQRSHEWFIESITNRECVFVGVRCNEFEGLINGRCNCDSSASACAIMGIHADQMYLNNLHRDIWPQQRGAKRGQTSRPGAAQGHPLLEELHPLLDPVQMALQEHLQAGPLLDVGGQPVADVDALRRPPNKDEIYAKLKQQSLNNKLNADHDHDDWSMIDELISGPAAGQAGDMLDGALIDYFRINFLDGPRLEPNPFADTIQELLLGEGGTRRSDAPGEAPPSRGVPAPDGRSRARPGPPRSTQFETLMTGSPNKGRHGAGIVCPSAKRQAGTLMKRGGAAPKSAPPSMSKRSGRADDNLRRQIMPDLPGLASSFDRDIEQWYEDTSRWFLKTNNKPSYCVNQYQLLVYLGPLRTSTEKRRIRANLIVSIIGTRGQLLNQRFVPRGATLESFTMQPFFILLEGAYSLGNIVSVAIGWEARYDPDPVQATISFESNLLQDLQSAWPATYRLRHSLFSPTLKHDHTRGFQQATGRSEVDQSLDTVKRSGRAPAREPDKLCPLDEGQHKSAQSNGGFCPRTQLPPLASRAAHSTPLVEWNPFSRPPAAPNQALLARPIDSPAPPHKIDRQRPFVAQGSPIERMMGPASQQEAGITAELHNIAGLAGEQLDWEDSIVLTKITVQPIQATYGRTNSRLGRNFCPPGKNFRLRRDHTVVLSPRLLGSCNTDYHLHPYHHHSTILDDILS